MQQRCSSDAAAMQQRRTSGPGDSTAGLSAPAAHDALRTAELLRAAAACAPPSVARRREMRRIDNIDRVSASDGVSVIVQL
jgi:hypothetical protein